MTDLSCQKHLGATESLVAESVPYLPFFPSARPDENLTSRCSRFHFERGNVKARESFEEIFGSPPFQMSSFSTPRIEALATRMPGDPIENARRLIHESTAMPLVALFSGVTVFDSNVQHTPRGMGGTGLTQICVDCVKQDIAEFGSPTLYRSHQFSVVKSCWRHSSRLIDRCPKCSCPIELPRDLVLAPWVGCACGFKFENFDQSGVKAIEEMEIALAKFVHVVLNGLPNGSNGSGLSRLLRIQAQERGFRRGQSLVDRVGLLAALEAHYTPELLGAVDATYRRGATGGWLNFLGQSSSALEGPFCRNLLLANFLFQDGESFLNAVKGGGDKRQTALTAKLPVRRADKSYVPTSPESELDEKFARLVALAGEKGIAFEDIWLKYPGAMKKIVTLGGAKAIDRLKLAIKVYPNLPSKRKVDTAVVHPKDQQWAEAVLATAVRAYNNSGKPVRVTMASLVKETGLFPNNWPDAASLPATRAACEAAAESQWHFYARRALWSMSRYYGKSVSQSLITEDTGLEHHRITDVYKYLTTLEIVPVAPFVEQLTAKGIHRNWEGPCPDKLYPKVGRGYVRVGKKSKGNISRDISPKTSTGILTESSA